MVPAADRLSSVDGRLVCATAANFFLVRDGRLLTPDIRDCGVAGVMRGIVLAAAEELFLTNSLVGVWPIRQLETRNYVVGKITQTLQQALPEELSGGGA